MQLHKLPLKTLQVPFWFTGALPRVQALIWYATRAAASFERFWLHFYVCNEENSYLDVDEKLDCLYKPLDPYSYSK